MAEVSEQSQSQDPQQQQPQAPQPPPQQPQAAPPPPVQLPAGVHHFYGTGRRKTSTARVFLRPGTGQVTVNERPFENYLPTAALRNFVLQPLHSVDLASRFDTTVTVIGGGLTGQASSIKLGIARALLEYDVDLRKRLKKAGFLSRDARIHERKKYGQKGARKRFQFSKR